MRARRRSSTGPVSGGIILLGTGVLLLTGYFWPWILVVIAIATLPEALHRNRAAGVLPALWLVALAILFATNTIWPGILILFGATLVLSGLIRGVRRR